MIWLALVLLAVVAMAPLAISARLTARARGRREAAMALHRAQLVELERDLADGQIGQNMPTPCWKCSAGCWPSPMQRRRCRRAPPPHRW
jgi:hypothetical protein